MKKHLILIGLTILFILSQLPSTSGESTIVILNPIEDSYVEEDEPGSNFGDYNFLYVTSEIVISDTPNIEKHGSLSYLKFDLSSIPIDAEIISAKLELYLGYINIDGTLSLPVYYCSDNSWKELEINYNNAPLWDPQIIDNNHEIDVKDQWYSWDILNTIDKAFIDNRITLVLNSNIVDYLGVLSFQSKDADNNKPKLTIEYTTANRSLEAKISFSPENPTTDDLIQFNDKSTGGVDIVSWFWDFGDGNTSESQNPIHSYNSNGTYLIKLDVRDVDGSTDLTTATLIVSELIIDEEDKNMSGENNEDDGKNENEVVEDDTPGFEFIIMMLATFLVIYKKRKK
jgi:PKD repeat protein